MGIFNFSPKHNVLLTVKTSYWAYPGNRRQQVTTTFYIAGKDENDALKRLDEHIRKKLKGDNILPEVISRVFIGALTDSREVFVP